MTVDSNVKILRDSYALWNTSKGESAQRWLDLLDEKVHWRSISDGAKGMEFTRECCSKTEVMKYFEELSNEWDMLHYTADEFIAQDDRVVMIGSCGWRSKRTGKSVDSPKVDIIRMKNGKIVEFFELFDTAKAIAASH